jgi:hypothetical protein
MYFRRLEKYQKIIIFLDYCTTVWYQVLPTIFFFNILKKLEENHLAATTKDGSYH